MKRLFWIGVGVAAAFYGSRWLRRQREKLTPENVAARAAERLGGVMELVRVSVEEGRKAAARKEAEIRASVGDGPPDRPTPTRPTA
ncbi:MAG: hypothetical protein ACRDKA_04395 [Actinomycetota bacterium]